MSKITGNTPPAGATSSTATNSNAAAPAAPETMSVEEYAIQQHPALRAIANSLPNQDFASLAVVDKNILKRVVQEGDLRAYAVAGKIAKAMWISDAEFQMTTEKSAFMGMRTDKSLENGLYVEREVEHYNGKAHLAHIAKIFGLDLSTLDKVEGFLSLNFTPKEVQKLIMTYRAYTNAYWAIREELDPTTQKFGRPHCSRGVLTLEGINHLPLCFKKLTTLRCLYIAGTVKDIPKELTNNVNLSDLTFYGDQFTHLPAFLKELRNLWHLTLPRSLVELPAEIPFMRTLGALNLEYTRITNIPTWIRKLSNLQFLKLSRAVAYDEDTVRRIRDLQEKGRSRIDYIMPTLPPSHPESMSERTEERPVMARNQQTRVVSTPLAALIEDDEDQLAALMLEQDDEDETIPTPNKNNNNNNNDDDDNDR